MNADSITPEVLDAAVMSETPEGILIELRPAGLAARFYAFMLDWFIRITVLSIAGSALAQLLGELAQGVLLVTYFAMEWLYPVAFELTRWGATPGKRAFGMKVVMDNGLPITPAASLTRNLLRAADFLPAAFGCAIVSMLLRRDFKRLGDIAAGTLVVYQPKPTAKPKLSELVAIAPTRVLTPRDQAALTAFAARAPSLTNERADELAALAASVAVHEGQSAAVPAGPEVTRRVLGVAQWLMGRR